MARFTRKIEPNLPFDFCDRCHYFKMRLTKITEDGATGKYDYFADCEHADICVNSVRMAKEEEYES